MHELEDEVYEPGLMEKAVSLLGPQRIEHRALHDFGSLLLHGGKMQECIADLLRGEPVNQNYLHNSIGMMEVAAIDLYFSLHMLEAVVAGHAVDYPDMMVVQFNNHRNELEKLLKQIEVSRKSRDLWKNPYPVGTPQYDKREVLDMVCTIAAREAAQKEEKPNE